MDISGADVEAEGITSEGVMKIQRRENLSYFRAMEWKFKHLWDSINEKRGFGWDANPFVWVYTFKVID